MPKGAYVPVFAARKARAQVSAMKKMAPRVWVTAAVIAILVIALALVWGTNANVPSTVDAHRSVAVLPLKMFGANDRQHAADQVAEVLTTELAKNRQLRVLSRTTASKYREATSSLPEIAQALGVRWVVEGGVGLEGTRAYVKLRAVDSLTDRKIWADVFDCELSELVQANVEAAHSIAGAIQAQLETVQY
jgi:TolB-like protein